MSGRHVDNTRTTGVLEQSHQLMGQKNRCYRIFPKLPVFLPFLWIGHFIIKGSWSALTITKCPIIWRPFPWLTLNRFCRPWSCQKVCWYMQPLPWWNRANTFGPARSILPFCLFRRALPRCPWQQRFRTSCQTSQATPLFCRPRKTKRFYWRKADGFL